MSLDRAVIFFLTLWKQTIKANIDIWVHIKLKTIKRMNRHTDRKEVYGKHSMLIIARK